MPRKRIKKKGKKRVTLRILTEELYDDICNNPSMGELLGDYKQSGFECGDYFAMFNKNDPEVCKEIWDRHKAEVMERWKTDHWNAGKRPYLWWVVEAPLRLNIERYDLHKDISDDLRQLNLLEDWEIKELERQKKLNLRD